MSPAVSLEKAPREAPFLYREESESHDRDAYPFRQRGTADRPHGEQLKDWHRWWDATYKYNLQYQFDDPHDLLPHLPEPVRYHVADDGREFWTYPMLLADVMQDAEARGAHRSYGVRLHLTYTRDYDHAVTYHKLLHEGRAELHAEASAQTAASLNWITEHRR